ncbi:MAG: FCD domain-containing protein [Rothia sp. (in: high G+C Gram-positive bacteria)]|uniref:FadR/GntR family transcriptional regulator n=1 Tax=Rothia sp. (in: high G+C Gram-positive bacteria) TaxID=1885016 RepID=UPI0026E033B3|nr:FCD domain-containing protein [Rothia sp. (in: high G+C Gram-positive bacteria)]MDO5751156.1 FCD domain-containing protein [Rothia sp. (in: high G+C Gram-positive bacteria)]
MAIHRKILRWVEDELSEGTIRLGQDLPDDAHIARAIGVGRTRTREALKVLEDMELLQLYSGRGKEIIPHLHEEPAVAAAAPLSLHMAASLNPTRDIVQSRILLESWAISQIDPEEADFSELDEALDDMYDTQGISEFLDAMLTVHHRLTRLGGNELISGLLAAIRQPTREALFEVVGRVPLWSSTRDRLCAEHRAIAEAVRHGDVSTARRLISEQLQDLYAEAQIDLDADALDIDQLPGVEEEELFEPLMDEELEELPDIPPAAPEISLSFGSSRPAVSESVEAEGAAPESIGVEELTESEIPAAVQSESVPATLDLAASADSLDSSESVEPASVPDTEEPESTIENNDSLKVVSAPESYGIHGVNTPASTGLSGVSQQAPAPAVPSAPVVPAAPVSAPIQQVPAPAVSAQQTPQPANTLSAVEQPVVREREDVLRASTSGVGNSARRRSGQISSPVRATIITPINRTGGGATLRAPQPSARSGRIVDAPSSRLGAAVDTGDRLVAVRAEDRVQAPARPSTLPSAAQAPAAEQPAVDTLRAPVQSPETPAPAPVAPESQESVAPAAEESVSLRSRLSRFLGVTDYQPGSGQNSDEAPKS